jgi:hypothetical protein
MMHYLYECAKSRNALAVRISNCLSEKISTLGCGRSIKAIVLRTKLK